MTDQQNIVLETERLIFRQLTMDDLDDLFALYNDLEVRKYYSEGIPSYEETKQELEWMINHCYFKYGFGMWATIHKETGKFIGRCGLTPMDIEGYEEIEVGYMLAKEYWGQGLATEAANAILQYGFDQMGLSRLICVINPGNQASSRVAMKIGMRLEIDGDVNGEPTLLYSINSKTLTLDSYNHRNDS
jgi:ribosomal-protein-alanine N-acetyltransferase